MMWRVSSTMGFGRCQPWGCLAMSAPWALARLAYQDLAGWSMEDGKACGALTATWSPCVRLWKLLVMVTSLIARFACFWVEGK